MVNLPSIPCSILLVVTLEACGRMRSTLSGQNRRRKMKTIVTKKEASSRVGTMMTSCSYTRISGRRRQQAQSSLTRLACSQSALVCQRLLLTIKRTTSFFGKLKTNKQLNSPQIVSPCWQRESASDTDDILLQVKGNHMKKYSLCFNCYLLILAVEV